MKKTRSRRTVLIPALIYGPPPVIPDRIEKMKKRIKEMKETVEKKGSSESDDKPDNT